MEHPLYTEHYKRLTELEKDRIFCCHELRHLVDVARIAYIENLENEMGFSKEMIYVAGILHDIGRDVQYLEGTPHEITSAAVAEKILKDISDKGGGVFTGEDIACIVRAIREHRFYDENNSELGKLLYRSDKHSRMCLGCAARELCNWDEEKKNREIVV